jgi:hypothetical protein
MSKIYFHTRTSTAELMGSERGWLRHLASQTARGWWGLDDMADPLGRAVDIAGMIVPNSCGQYIKTTMAEVGRYSIPYPTDNHVAVIKDYAQQALDDRAWYEETWKRYTTAGLNPVHEVHCDFTGRDRLVDVLRTCLRVHNVPLQVGDHVVFSMNVELNTALAAGNLAVCLAAKIHGWCEIHPWIEETDREEFADLIGCALQDGLYREGLWYDDGRGKRTWHDQGWADVIALLRDTTTHPGPVVLSSSVCDQFPNPEVSAQMIPWPEGVPESWNALTIEQQEARKTATSLWYALPDDQKWDTCMEGIRRLQPWANLTRDNLDTTMFGPPVSLFDLFHPDRIDRVEQAFIIEQMAEAEEADGREKPDEHQ